MTEDFLRALADDFEKHGADAIEQCRINHPKDYLKVIASLLPHRAELDVALDMTPELRQELHRFASDYRMVRDAILNIGSEIPLLESDDVD